ncbi:glyceraldehyde-3-phosphate dehydrogenase [[Clostridium] ultunense Esp]|uniref:glyceraldehyde-3-phosphate dehydrogenase n=1 Tax=Thermicanus aegyptius TaxID=94009 RepID=UPI0002B70320|nr:glyceraldehyde-3-phosphate dehydrogenase [Thermicanus aegyptius]CCQ93607.1 glyceraldehyde-3-phosphate dehydrogenase [[Clostridium] ultunense Esp]
MTKLAINGFGRIGRMVFRRLAGEENFEVVAINASYPPETLAHLLKYDSVHGTLAADVETGEDWISVNGKKTKIIGERNPAFLPWKEFGVEIVVEATGKFNHREGASLHLEAGAEKVILTAPGKDEDVTIVMGVNEGMYNPKIHRIISNASCTTNALAPVVKVIHETFGIHSGMMTTVHSYTNDQRNLDNPHKDLRRARASGLSIIPTTTGAAKAIGKVLPELKGKLNGIALRVPTPNVSLVDLVAEVDREVTPEEVNEALRVASEGELKGILQVSFEPLVSSDYNGNSHSAIVDALSTMVLGKSVKIFAWYDNEWGYSCRVVDLLNYIDRFFRSPRQRTDEVYHLLQAGGESA